MNFIKKYKKILILFFVFFVISFAYNMSHAEVSKKEINYNEFIKQLNSGEIHTLYINNSFTNAKEIAFYNKSEKDKPELKRTYYKVLTPSFEKFWEKFENNPKYKDIIVQMKPIPQEGFFITLIKSMIPIIVIIAILVFLQKGAMSNLGKNKIEMLKPEKIKVTFDDVIGIDEIKQEVEETVQFLKTPEKFAKAGAKMPKGIILSGQPGTGKTMLAKALAKEANVPFFYASGSSFVEMFVGLGAARVRNLFAQAKKSAPCIIFIDEIDAVGGERGKGFGGSHDEREGTLNELLVQMDGMDENNGVFIMGATNRLENLDKALIRPGRFDRQLVVPLPNLEGRLELITKLSKQYKMDENFDMKEASRGVVGLSSAEITNLMNEAAILQVRKNKETLDQECFNEALDKIIMGMSNGHKLTDKDKTITAYHEAGHAVVGLFLEGSDPVHKVTIVPRGQALGVTMSLPEEDRVHYSKKYLLTQISMLYGGFCAEAKFIGDNTTGASNDIERATSIAKRMITVWGLNENLNQYVYLEQDKFGSENFNLLSEKKKEQIEDEIEKVLTKQKNITMGILDKYQHVVEKMVEMLLDKEVITEKDIYDILKECQIPEDKIPAYLKTNYGLLSKDDES